jgi:hypothetical protein
MLFNNSFTQTRKKKRTRANIVEFNKKEVNIAKKKSCLKKK